MSNKQRTKKVHGVGINDADYRTREHIYVEGKRKVSWKCPAYSTWTDMLYRCYSEHSHKINPTYKDCNVCDEWLRFSSFNKWFKDNYIKGYQLDKDILVKGNRTYGPDVCIFLDKKVNCFISMKSKGLGKYPLGVSLGKRSGGFFARCRRTSDSFYKHLGRYSTIAGAHRAWQMFKREQAIHLQSQQTDPRTIKGLQRIIDKLQHHIDNGIETKDL